MSSYPVLDNKPIDQWKVTELKEELKRRKLKVNGLKDDLIRRLFESMQNEGESAKVNDDNNGFASAPKHVQPLESKMIPLVDERTKGVTDKNEKGKNGLDIDIVQPSVTGFTTENVTEENSRDTSVQVTTLETSVEGMTVETNLEVAAVVSVVSKSLVTEGTLSGQELQNEFLNKSEDLSIQLQSKDSSPPHEEAKRSSSDLDNQVYDVSKVTTDSISTDNVLINEKIELKDNIIADDINLEFDVKPEMEEPSSSNVVLDEGNLQPMNVEEPQGNEINVVETGKNADNSASTGNISCEDIGISEKLNLDRSSGDDSLDEDTLDSKQIDSKPISDEVCDKGGRIEEPVMIEGTRADAMVDDLCTEKKDENINDLAIASMKRKLYGQKTVAFSETIKRQRRWNPDSLKVVETQSSSIAQSTTPMDAFQSTTPRDAFQATAKRELSRSKSTASDETLKEERVVPPSAKPSTNSLRIDRFLRPFTLKAVQELLGKKGTVTNFWMDHIKTHCYVTYSSVEEAIETRNTIYNLQWPKNGGRLLIAEFVEPQEVQMRVEAPPSPATPVSTVPTLPPTLVPIQPQHSPRLQVQRQMLPTPPPPPLPASVLPPPPLSNPPLAGERALPPPPPRPAKAIDPPSVTLDDLFRKTRATPRIYYLPLSDEQVAAKQKAKGKTIEQSLD